MRRLVTAACALLFAASAYASSDVIRRGFNVADGGTLELEAGIGNITVVAGGSGVAFEVHRDARGRGGEEQMASHKITFTQRGNDVVVDGKLEDRWHNWFRNGDYEVQWNIRVPAHYNVRLRTSGGSIDLADLGGTVNAYTSGGSIKTGKLAGAATLNTSGGDITLAGARGNVTAHTSGGSIEVGDTTGAVDVRTSGGSIHIARTGGNVIARTSGGGIRIDDALGSVDATTSGGSIEAQLSRQPAGDSRLSTSGGGVTVRIASGLGFELDARASGGGVHSDVPVTVQGSIDDDEMHGRINGGGPRLVLRSSGGGIRVRNL
ncbi:MAG TPA: DUF4097 family beta strand repeat-containing protein [Thermoanaerobaculia bacterium]|jgi:DUF4097 and DUF4098 domain-containing protein YvlB